MPMEFKKGDKVVWSSHGTDDTPGVVERKITSDTELDRARVPGGAAVPRPQREGRRRGRPQARRPQATLNQPRGTSSCVQPSITRRRRSGPRRGTKNEVTSAFSARVTADTTISSSFSAA